MELSPADAVAVLERTPAALQALLEGLADSWLLANEGPDTFSPRDVIGHLIHGEETDWVPRMRIILDHGEAVPFTPFDRFAFRTASVGHSTSALLERFAALRGSWRASIARRSGLGASTSRSWIGRNRQPHTSSLLAHLSPCLPTREGVESCR